MLKTLLSTFIEGKLIFYVTVFLFYLMLASSHHSRQTNTVDNSFFSKQNDPNMQTVFVLTNINNIFEVFVCF